MLLCAMALSWSTGSECRVRRSVCQANALILEGILSASTRLYPTSKVWVLDGGNTRQELNLLENNPHVSLN